MRADFSGMCASCWQPIRKGADDIVFRHGAWIHSACHPGGTSDEG